MPTKIEAALLEIGPDRRADFPVAGGQLRGLGLAADMHVGAALALRRHAVDGAARLAVDQDDALVALAHLGQIALGDERLAEHLQEKLDQGGEVLVALALAEDAGAAVAVERLQDDIAVPVAEAAQLLDVAGDQRRRHEIGVADDKQLLRRVAHLHGIVDDQGRGMNVLEQMGGGDVVHVEGRILAHEHDVEARQGRHDAPRRR